MSYRRALVMVELRGDARPALAALKALSPRLEHLVVIATLPPPAFGSFFGAHPAEPGEALPALVRLAAAALPTAAVRVVPEPSDEALLALVGSEELEVAVAGSASWHLTRAMGALRRAGLAVLVPHGEAREGPPRHLWCFARDRREGLALRAFLRDHSDASVRVTALGPASRDPQELAVLAEMAGIEATVEDARGGSGSLEPWLDGRQRGREVDLVVLARASRALLGDARWPAPVLLLPPLVEVSRPPALRALDVADAAELGGALRVRLGETVLGGSPRPLPDQPVAFVSGGEVLVTVSSRDGEVELPAGLGAGALGVYRPGVAPQADPVAAVEQSIVVCRQGGGPLLLFDADLPDELLRALAGLKGPPAPELWAVRLRPTRSCGALRTRLRAAGLSPRVLDARAVLAEGEALDVSETLDALRLARVGSRLAHSGFPVAAVLNRGGIQPQIDGVVALSAPALLGEPGALAEKVTAKPRPVAAHEPIAGNRIVLELDNAVARGWVLEAIAAAKHTVWFQVYMALDDEVARQVEASLAAAGARGVEVKVLVDSLHGLHGSLGATNALLERLAARPGVEVRVSRPITALPSLTAIKQRDHRKLVVVDGTLALLGGRNLSHEYYAAFPDVLLTPGATWRQVPWLDAGARVEGPAVAALASSFNGAWIEAGGQSLGVTTPAAAGSVSARVVVHHGLRDVSILETYVQLVEAASTHVYTVNGFPLVLELQHALLRALRRGVRVCSLVGHLVPMHGDGEVFGGPWSMARAAATDFVHSRFDPLVAEGAEVWLFAVPEQPGWARGLGMVHPHVHAKVMSVDGRRCTVGSANLDVTASYWESELILVVEDEGLVRGLEARIEALVRSSTRMSRDDPKWREQARRRAWMRHWPGMLSL